MCLVRNLPGHPWLPGPPTYVTFSALLTPCYTAPDRGIVRLIEAHDDSLECHSLAPQGRRDARPHEPGPRAHAFTAGIALRHQPRTGGPARSAPPASAHPATDPRGRRRDERKHPRPR